MSWSRREWLSTMVAGAAGAVVLSGCDDDPGPACGDPHWELPELPVYTHAGPLGPEHAFELGVASGDPLPDAVILWTRVSGATEPVDVWWEVALDPDFTRRVLAGTTTTDASRDHTVKVDAQGLRPGLTYYYRFFALGRGSVIGRTRTTPVGHVRRVRLAVASCSSLAHGLFHAYRRIAERTDLDAVVHLGDYIYEYGSGEYGSARPYEPPHECLTLDDYRTRYRQYRRDPDLAEAHRQHPFIAIWDDHEVADDAWDQGAANHQDSEGSYLARREAAFQAFFEYLPIRASSTPIYRSFAFGDLLDLFMLDTRHDGRAKELDSASPDTPDRRLISAAQESFLESGLAASAARWHLVGQQVVMSRWTATTPTAVLNRDAWDGYAAARARVYDLFEAHGDGHVVVLTGDVHSGWAFDLVRDPWSPSYDPTTGAGVLGIELVTPGITSPSFEDDGFGTDFFAELVRDACPHNRYGNSIRRGYLVLDIRPDKVQGDFYVLDGTGPGQGTESFAAAVAIEHGKPRAVVMDRPEAGRAGCEAAP